jgi:hypothetical protein
VWTVNGTNVDMDVVCTVNQDSWSSTDGSITGVSFAGPALGDATITFSAAPGEIVLTFFSISPLEQVQFSVAPTAFTNAADTGDGVTFTGLEVQGTSTFTFPAGTSTIVMTPVGNDAGTQFLLTSVDVAGADAPGEGEFVRFQRCYERDDTGAVTFIDVDFEAGAYTPVGDPVVCPCCETYTTECVRVVEVTPGNPTSYGKRNTSGQPTLREFPSEVEVDQPAFTGPAHGAYPETWYNRADGLWYGIKETAAAGWSIGVWTYDTIGVAPVLVYEVDVAGVTIPAAGVDTHRMDYSADTGKFYFWLTDEVNSPGGRQAWIVEVDPVTGVVASENQIDLQWPIRQSNTENAHYAIVPGGTFVVAHVSENGQGPSGNTKVASEHNLDGTWIQDLPGLTGDPDWTMHQGIAWYKDRQVGFHGIDSITRVYDLDSTTGPDIVGDVPWPVNWDLQSFFDVEDIIEERTLTKVTTVADGVPEVTYYDADGAEVDVTGLTLLPCVTDPDEPLECCPIVVGSGCWDDGTATGRYISLLGTDGTITQVDDLTGDPVAAGDVVDCPTPTNTAHVVDVTLGGPLFTIPEAVSWTVRHLAGDPTIATGADPAVTIEPGERITVEAAEGAVLSELTVIDPTAGSVRVVWVEVD